MFGRKKRTENRHIIAIKDYTNFVKSIKDGSIYLPYEKELYIDLLKDDPIKLDNTKGLRKFAKASNKKKADVQHYWHSLINQGYTLLNVKYDKKYPTLPKLCNNDTIKYISDIN